MLSFILFHNSLKLFLLQNGRVKLATTKLFFSNSIFSNFCLKNLNCFDSSLDSFVLILGSISSLSIANTFQPFFIKYIVSLPAPHPSSTALPGSIFNSINFLTVCRLVKQKAIDRFIRVHSKLIKQGLKHKVYIIGDGPEKENLQKLIKQENVEDTFILLGKKENPYPYIKNANYFCLLSEFEGYGMVLEEAKILNKPIIITNTAARECIENYPKALILENSEDEIYDGLYKLLNDNDDKIFNNTQTNTEYDNTEKLQKIIELVGD